MNEQMELCAAMTNRKFSRGWWDGNQITLSCRTRCLLGEFKIAGSNTALVFKFQRHNMFLSCSLVKQYCKAILWAISASDGQSSSFKSILWQWDSPLVLKTLHHSLGADKYIAVKQTQFVSDCLHSLFIRVYLINMWVSQVITR